MNGAMVDGTFADRIMAGKELASRVAAHLRAAGMTGRPLVLG